MLREPPVADAAIGDRAFFLIGPLSGGLVEGSMDTTTILIILIVVLILFGGGWYGRGRWF
jgi:hypothetical protein